MRVDIWSDIACPWCYVGKRRFEAALAAFEHRDRVEVVWRAFELDPTLPPVLPAEPSYAERLARKYGTSVAGAEEMIARMTQTAANEGLEFRFDRIRPGNTFDAHRLLHFALERGCQDALKERLFAAYLCEGEAIGERATLVRQAEAVGLDPDEAARRLDGDAHAAEVRADEQLARSLGIRGVPFFVFDGRAAVSGAQPPEVMQRVLDEVWRQEASEADDDAAACGPAGCAV